MDTALTVLTCSFPFFALIVAFGKYWSKKPIARWSLLRKYHFTAWVVVAFLCTFVAAERITTHGSRPYFWTDIAIGTMMLILFTVPCGMKFINDHWWLRLARDGFFLILSAQRFMSAFHAFQQ